MSDASPYAGAAAGGCSPRGDASQRPDRLAGRFAAWASAWLAGAVGYDDALDAITGGRLHLVSGSAVETGFPVGSSEVPLGWALPVLRTRGVTAVRIALPVPGDVAGLPGDAELRARALDAGGAAVAVSGSSCLLAFVPAVVEHGSPVEGVTVTVRWAAYDCAGEDRAGEPSRYLPVAEADHGLRRAVVESAEELARLDVARWRPEIAEALTDLRVDARRGHDEGRELPPGWPARARDLLGRADTLGRVVALARGGPGAEVTGEQTRGRVAALVSLERAVRRARLAAYNCYGIEPP